MRKIEVVLSLIIHLWVGCFELGSGEDSLENLPPNRARLIFNIIKFQNHPCGSGTEIGTCYTSDECTAKRGTAGESCASGYGTCCIFSTGCGDTISENSTYLRSPSPIPSTCVYTVCQTHSHICRIRFDFRTFTLNGPDTDTTNVNSYGSCNTDSFVASSATGASPVICGANTRQHIIVDAQDACNSAIFNSGAGTQTQSWDILVTQYHCGDEFGGPPGCLQYFREDMGTVQSFNYDAMGGPIHLSSQDYNICFRRGSGNCRICYSAFAKMGPDTFGLSTSVDKNPQSATNADCSTDFIEIPGGLQITDVSQKKLPAITAFRNCGRFLNTKRGLGASATVCSFAVPFRLRFFSDATEALKMAGPDTNEAKGNPMGNMGFKLAYKQFPCA